MSTIGYARVSTRDQDPGSQVRELEQAGAIKIFVDHGESSRRRDRPQWQACMDYLRVGDTLVVRSLDRLAGSERIAIEVINDLGERGINLRSLTEPDIDTTTPMGRALFGIVAVFAQLRVDTIRANTLRGLERARAEGRVGGRPSVMDEEKITAMLDMRQKGYSHARIARLLRVSETTIRRHLQAHQRDEQRP